MESSQTVDGQTVGATHDEPGCIARPKSRLKRFGCWLWSLIRWGYVLFLFLYLFAMIIALFEAHGFQQLVSHLIATEDDLGGTADQYRRQVVLISVGEAHALRNDTDASQAFLNQIAGRVGGMRTAIEELSDLDGKFRLARAEDAETPQQRFDGLVKKIESANEQLTAAALTALIRSPETKPDGVGASGTEPAAADESLPSLAAAARARTMRSLVDIQVLVSKLAQLSPIQEPTSVADTWNEGTKELDRSFRKLARATLNRMVPPGEKPAGTPATDTKPVEGKVTALPTGNEPPGAASMAALLDAQTTFRTELDTFVKDHRPKLPKGVPSKQTDLNSACLPSDWLSAMQVEGWNDLKLETPPVSDHRVPYLKAGLYVLGFYPETDLTEKFTPELAVAVKRLRDTEPAKNQKQGDLNNPSIANSAFRGLLTQRIKDAIDEKRVVLAGDNAVCPSEAGHLVHQIKARLDALEDNVRDDDPRLRLLAQVYRPIAQLGYALDSSDHYILWSRSALMGFTPHI